MPCWAADKDLYLLLIRFIFLRCSFLAVVLVRTDEEPFMKIAQIAPLFESVPPQLYGGTERVVSSSLRNWFVWGMKLRSLPAVTPLRVRAWYQDARAQCDSAGVWTLWPRTW